MAEEKIWEGCDYTYVEPNFSCSYYIYSQELLKIWQSVETFTVNYLYFELGTSRYLIVIVEALCLGKMHINLALSHFKKDHSLVIIQLHAPAIFSPIFPSTLKFCWHQKRGCLSAGWCCLLVFSSIRMVPITWGCRMFLEPAMLPGFQRVWSSWKGTKQSRAWLSPSPGVTWLSPMPTNPERLPCCSQLSLQELSNTYPGSLRVDRAAEELEAAGEGPSFSWLWIHIPCLLKSGCCTCWYPYILTN